MRLNKKTTQKQMKTSKLKRIKIKIIRILKIFCKKVFNISYNFLLKLIKKVEKTKEAEKIMGFKEFEENCQKVYQ